MRDIKIYNGDCLEIMKQIPNKSTDCIIADIPYGTTACEWDSIMDLNSIKFIGIELDPTDFNIAKERIENA